MKNTLSETEIEMLQAKNVCNTFDFEITQALAKRIGGKRIIFTGMGSSMIFPAKQAKSRAMKLRVENKVEAYFASDLFQYTDFSDTFLFLCSNSGKTKEVILLLEHAKKHGATCVAVTAVADSLLAKRCDEKFVLTCGFEKGVAATKSVVEQGLIYDSLIFHLAKNQGKNVDFGNLQEELVDTGEKIVRNIETKASEAIIDALVAATHFFMVGFDNGVAEEITLKAYEIARKMALFYPDTHIVHGVEEVINGDCTIIFEPSEFSNYMNDFEKFSQKTKSKLIGIDKKLSMDGFAIEINEQFRNYCLLAGGWGLLRAVANRQGIDIDHPQRASKVGNPYSQ